MKRNEALEQEYLATFAAEYDPSYPTIPVPGRMMLIRWVLYGTSGGDFCDALVSNNLQGAVGHADTRYLAVLPAMVRWLYNRAPAQSIVTRGSNPDKIREWANTGGLVGRHGADL